MFIHLFLISTFNEWNENIKWIYIKENSKIIIIRYMRIHI
jgi:hypothetical protein